ncbi:MAG: PAS domain S-box protein [Alphaproteobacteria bacterium]|nr:PAS domain S-box protein [Alphaproteobacteria bacterium]
MPEMMGIARLVTLALGLILLTSVGGGFYYFNQIRTYHTISYLVAEEAFLARDITLESNQYSELVNGAGALANGMAYAKLSEGTDALERNHQALRQKVSSSIYPLASFYPLISPGHQKQLSREDALVTEFIADAHAYLQAGGRGESLVQQNSGKVIAMVKEFADEMEMQKQGAVYALMQFDMAMFASVIAVLIWFWFTRMKPISLGASAMAQQALEIEQRLHTEEERAKALLQFSIDPVISFDERGVIESFNLSAETVFGYETDEILGKPIKLLMSEKEAFYSLRHFRSFKPRDLASLANGVSMTGRRKNGENFTARLIVNELSSKGRHGFVATVHDQSEEISANAQLQESLERFDLCVRRSDSAIWDVDLRSGEMFIAPRLMQLLGYDEHEPLTRMSRLLQPVHPEDREIVRSRAGTSHIRDSSGFESRFRMRNSNGDYLWFQNKGAYRRDSNGAVIRVAGSITEITARVEAEEELRQHRDHLVKMVDAQTRHIKKSEARLATAISGISEGLCLVDENKLIILVNRHLLDMYPEVAEIMNPGVSLDDIFVELLDKNRSDDARIRFISEHFSALRGDAPAKELALPDGS